MTKLNPRCQLDPKLFAEHKQVVLGGLHAAPVESQLSPRVSSCSINFPLATCYFYRKCLKDSQPTVSTFSCLKATASTIDCDIS
jgi:hypothetical protein